MGEDQVNAAIGFGAGGIFLIVPVLIVYPIWRCLRRAGYKPAWSLLVLIPFLGLFAAMGILGVLAFAKWPVVYGRPEPTSWNAFSRTSWVAVSGDEAAGNRYFGFEGMLLASYGLIVVSAVPTLLNMSVGFYRDSMRITYGLSETGAMLLGLVVVVWMVLLLVLMPLRRAFVPMLIVCLSWLYVAGFVAVIYAFADPDAPLAAETQAIGGHDFYRRFGVVSGVVSVALATWYWLKSKRVNVTYRHRVPAA